MIALRTEDCSGDRSAGSRHWILSCRTRRQITTKIDGANRTSKHLVGDLNLFHVGIVDDAREVTCTRQAGRNCSDATGNNLREASSRRGDRQHAHRGSYQRQCPPGCPSWREPAAQDGGIQDTPRNTGARGLLSTPGKSHAHAGPSSTSRWLSRHSTWFVARNNRKYGFTARRPKPTRT